MNNLKGYGAMGITRWGKVRAGGLWPVLVLIGCSGESEEKTSDAAIIAQGQAPSSYEGAETLSQVISANALAEAFPGTLALTVFPQAVNSSALVAAKDDPKQRSPQEKLSEAVSLLSGDADSCLPSSLARNEQEEGTGACYDFDSDMIYSTGSMGTRGTLDGTDGLGEACMVSFARDKMQAAVDLVERAKDRFAALICQAKKDGVAQELPAQGSELVLTDTLKKALGNRVSTVEQAVMTRLDDVNGRPVYRMSIKLTDTAGSRSFTREMNLVNSPGDDPQTFDGVLWMKDVASDEQQQGGGDIARTPKARLFSVAYSGSVDDDGQPRLSYELRKARVHTELLADAFSSEGVLDLNVGRNFAVAESDANYGRHRQANGTYYQEANQAIEGITQIGFQVNPETQAGNIAYWQNPGGRYTEPTRGMVFNATYDEDAGQLYGCATSGASGSFSAGLSIGRALKAGTTLEPSSYWHPFLNLSNQQNWEIPPSSTPQSDANGSYFEGTPRGPGQQQQSQDALRWYIPNLSDTALATRFVSEGSGNWMTRQCFRQNSEGIYAIDSSQISEAAGYQLIEGTSPQRPRPPEPSLARGIGAPIF